MTLRVESDARLARDVGPPAADLPLPGVAGAGSLLDPYLLPPNPWEFLLAAGRATASIFSPVKELFEVSSHWAIARWFWAIDWGTTDLRLSSYAAAIRNHHRTAFSEALGLAAGLLVTEHIAGHAVPHGIWRGGPMILDVDSFVSSGTRPDLLIVFGDPGQHLYVLETKGNSSGRGYSVEQLGRGISQVLAAPGPATRLVVGSTGLTGEEVGIHAISVAATQHRSGWVLELVAERGPEIEKARLRSFAGLGLAAQEPEVLSIPELEVDVVGRQLLVPGEGFSALLTLGVDRRVFDNLPRIGSLEEMSRARLEVLGDGHRGPPGGDDSAPLLERGSAAAIALDGCALSISLQ